MAAESREVAAATAPSGVTGAGAGAASAPARTVTGEEPGELLVEAQEFEIVLPSGDGVGPFSGTIRAGEQILLLGPSGSGKSTLLRGLAGAIPSHVRATTRGSLLVGGADPVQEGVVALADTVGFLGQDPVSGICLPQVDDDVALPLENRAVPPQQITPRITQALTAVGAAELGPRRASTLSGGQMQRVALATASVPRPRLLLLDEPTAMLDADGVAAVRAQVRAAMTRPGVASVLVEHRLDDWAGALGTAGLPERTIALDRSGRVLADGPTPAVLAEHGPALQEMGCWLPQESGRSAPTGGTGADETATDESAAGGTAAETDHRPLLTARGLQLGYGSREVLSGIDLELRAGEVLAIVGRNGAGKSTLLSALARLDAPRGGSVDGAAAGLVLQRPEAQFVGSTVRAELADTGASPDRIEQMLQRLGLSAWEGTSPYRLSGGQQRRLSLGAMLLRDRPVLLADEPGFGLDRGAHHVAMQLLRDAAQDGRAVAFTTHDPQALQVADRVAVIAHGRLERVCTPAQLLGDRDLQQAAGLAPGGGAGRDGEPAPVPAQGQDLGRASRRPASPGHGPGSHGPLSRANPTVLLGMLTALSVVCLFLFDPTPLLVLYGLLVAGVMAGTRLGPRGLLRGQAPFAMFAAGILVVNMLSRPGHEPWPELPVRITAEGIEIGAALALRALVIGLGALGVARACDARRMMVSLQTHARIPARYAVALLAGRRLLDELPAQWRTLTRAHRLRLDLDRHGQVPPLGPRRMLTCAFALLVDGVRSAERIAFALEARGLGEGPRSVWRPVPLTGRDALLVAGTAAVVALVLVVF